MLEAPVVMGIAAVVMEVISKFVDTWITFMLLIFYMCSIKKNSNT